MRKLLIYLIFILIGACLQGFYNAIEVINEDEPVIGSGLPMRTDDGEITNVLTTYHFFESYLEVNESMRSRGIDYPPVEGYSECWRDVEHNIAYCDIFMVRPTEIDGSHTLTAGHEQWHGVYGPEFHDVEGY